LPHSNEAKEELLDVCRQYYQDNFTILDDINNFANNYDEKSCIWWYTAETFVYKLINKALRTEDIEQLYTFRYYIADLSKQLAQKCRETIKKEGTNFYLYRGTVFSKKEVEILQTNKGRLIATNGYWSTSRSRQTALEFANKFKDDADKQNILFEIQCDLHDSTDTIIVADISSFSDFDENEFLFDAGSIFSIENIRIERENVGTELIIVHLKTSARGREIAQKYLEENEREMQYESPIIMLGILLRRLGKYDKSLHYFEKLRDNPGQEKLSHILNRIGVAYRDKGKYHDALDCFNKAYNLITNANPPERVYLALIRHNQGQVHFKQYRTQLALKFYEEAADILTKEISDSNRYIAEVYRNIGRVYSYKCNYKMALRYQFDALNVRRKCLASDDVVFAFSYEEIGKVYSYLEQYDEALNYHLQALELRRKHLPPIHHNTALSFYQVGKMYYKLYKPKEAFQHDKQALEIMEKYPSSDFQRSNVLSILQHMILISKRRPQTALPYQLKLLEIKKNNDSVNYPDVVDTLLEISAIYRFINKTEDALNFNKDALDIQITKQLANESYLAREYFCLASEYKTLGNMQCALDCYQQTLNINKRIYPRDHPFCVKTEKKINYIKSGQQRHTNTKVFSTGNRRSTFRHY
jgi:tetratricopeptide (TPR) repeat protein